MKNNNMKRILAATLSLLTVAAYVPANVGGLLTGGSGIVANASTVAKSQLATLFAEVSAWAGDNGEALAATDVAISIEFSSAMASAQGVLTDAGAADDEIEHAYNDLYSSRHRQRC